MPRCPTFAAVRSTFMVTALIVAVLAVMAPRLEAQPSTNHYAVASENEAVTRAAMAQMRAGGNAVDAAVAAAFVAGVVSPTSSGIGGGGFALVWNAKDKSASILDFREAAPRAIDVAAFERRPLSTQERGKLVGVPGEVAGLFELHHRFGRRKWSDVVRPASEEATRGFTVSRHVDAVVSGMGETLLREAALKELFYPGGQRVGAGGKVKNPKLGATLARIAAAGAKAFYEGPVAADLVESSNAYGGALSLTDLAEYKPKTREPLHVTWEGYEIYTMPPPSAGGLMLAEVLGLFSRDELVKLGFNSGPYIHVVAEATRGALVDRYRYVGDPSVEVFDVRALLDPAKLSRRKNQISVERTHGTPRFGEEHGTEHLVTADGDGNVVSLTTTVNDEFGSRIVASTTGIVLNDELDDFTSQSAVAPFGMNSSPNRPRPLARPVSSMTPTVVLRDGAVVLALGGSGGMKIAPNVTQVLLSRLVFGTAPEDAVRAPRFSIPTEGAYLTLEPGATKDLIDDLEWRGEILSAPSATRNAVQLIAFETGRAIPAADPRKFGRADAVQ